jgi:arsenate reductase
MKMYCYKKCSTCKKAEEFLTNHDIPVNVIDYTEEPLSELELLTYYKRSGQDIAKFFNTSGRIYRELNLKDKLPHLELNEKIKLLASEPMLIKRPLVVIDDDILLGFDEIVWRERLGLAQEA